jgi:hypothetical protein
MYPKVAVILTQIHGMNNPAVALYRQVLRECKRFPVVTIRNKLRYNVREMFDIQRVESNPGALQPLAMQAAN